MAGIDINNANIGVALYLGHSGEQTILKSVRICCDNISVENFNTGILQDMKLT